MNLHRHFDTNDPITEGDHAIGHRSSVTIVEYGDFECPICKQAVPVVKLALARFAGEICFVFRHFPLVDSHPHALVASEAAEAAGGQGKFWQMHDMLFENQDHLKRRQLDHYAEVLELDMERYRRDMNDHSYIQRIRENIDAGRKIGVRATPAFFVNGVLHDVSFGMDSLMTAIETSLAARPEFLVRHVNAS